MDEQWLFVIIEALSGRPSSHINAIFSLLKGIALQAWRLNIITLDAYLRVTTTRSLRASSRPKRRRLPREAISRLIDDCIKDGRKRGHRDAALLALLFGCGLCRSEVVRIDIADLDHSEHSVLIRGKQNNCRCLCPPPRVWDRVSEWLRESGKSCGPLFCSIRRGDFISGDRLTVSGVNLVIKNIVMCANIPRFTPRHLRSDFISYLLDRGHDTWTVAEIVGHADLQTTAGYDERGEERKKIANRAIKL